MVLFDPHALSVHDLAGDELAEYTAWHIATYGIPPLAGGDDGGAGGEGGGEGGPEGEPANGGGEGGPEGEPDDPAKWKALSRKNETEAKKARARAEKAEAELAKLQQGQQTDHEKAVTEAAEKARQEERDAAAQTTRADRLEVAVTRAAARGLEIEVDGEKKKVKFADPEDALVHIERKIARGELDADEVYDDDNKVNAEILNEALRELLTEKSYLRAGDGQKVEERPQGGADGGKGSGGGKGVEDMSPDDHLKAIRRHK